MKRSMFSVFVLSAVLAFLYVPIILVVAYGFVPNGIAMTFFASDGSFLGFTGKWYGYIFDKDAGVCDTDRLVQCTAECCNGPGECYMPGQVRGSGLLIFRSEADSVCASKCRTDGHVHHTC